MQGPHDMGGKHGFGAIKPDPDEPLFHYEWEKRAFALVLAMGFTGQWNIDISRHARENLSYTEYLTLGYYGIWFTALLQLMQNAHLVAKDEIETATNIHPPRDITPLAHNNVDNALNAGGPSTRLSDKHPKFSVGDRVRTSIDAVSTHTRLPSFAKGKVGIIIAHHGTHVFPDTNAHGNGGDPQHLYTVAISGDALWGKGAEPNTNVSLDLFEPYLSLVDAI